MRIIEELAARGHPNITATHPTTIEITKSVLLTKKGDCVVAVEATKGLTDLSRDFRRLCMNDKSRIVVELNVSGMVERVTGTGSHLLTLTDERDLVIRKSTYTSDRTLMIKADKAASDLRRQFIQRVKSTAAEISVRLTVFV